MSDCCALAGETGRLDMNADVMLRFTYPLTLVALTCFGGALQLQPSSLTTSECVYALFASGGKISWSDRAIDSGKHAEKVRLVWELLNFNLKHFL